MANAHAEQFAKIEGVSIESCYDVDNERAKAYAAKHNVPHVASDANEVIERVDAVSIVTTDRFHGELSVASLAADKHVLCEKPLTLTLEEARVVAEAAAKASQRGIIHMVNFSYRSSAAFQQAIRLAKDGTLGQIRHVHSFYLQQWLNGHGIESAKASPASLWRLSTGLGSGGVLGDLGCHILDLTSATSEDFKSVRCDLRTFPKKVDGHYTTEAAGVPLDANDTAIIEFELAGGGVGVCHTTRWATGHGNHLRMEAHGTEGAFWFDLDDDPNTINLCIGEDRFKSPWGSRENWTPKALAPTPTNWVRFIQSIRTGVQDQPDLLRGAQVQAYLDACERSAKSGEWETVRSHLPGD